MTAGLPGEKRADQLRLGPSYVAAWRAFAVA